jgi:hypothetical protein
MADTTLEKAMPHEALSNNWYAMRNITVSPDAMLASYRAVCLLVRSDAGSHRVVSEQVPAQDVMSCVRAGSVYADDGMPATGPHCWNVGGADDVDRRAICSQPALLAWCVYSLD